MNGRELIEELSKLTKEELEMPVTYFNTEWLEFMEINECSLYGDFYIHLN